MALGPLIPEGAAGGVALADVFLGLLALLAFVVCYGALYGWKHTFGALIDALTSLLTIRVLGFHVNFGWPLDKLNNYVQHALSAGVVESEKAMGRFFHAAGVALGWMVNYALATATTMEHAFSWLIHVGLRKFVTHWLYVALPPAYLAKLVGHQLAKLLPHVGKVAKAAAHETTTVIYRPVRAFERRLARDEALLHRLYAHVTHAVGSIALPLPVDTPAVNWRGFTKRLSRIERRLHKAEGWLAAGALAVALGNVLGVGARCLRSGGVGRTARRICGMDTNLLESLLQDTLAVVGVISVVEFATDLRTIEDEAVAILRAGIREFPK